MVRPRRTPRRRKTRRVFRRRNGYSVPPTITRPWNRVVCAFNLVSKTSYTCCTLLILFRELAAMLGLDNAAQNIPTTMKDYAIRLHWMQCYIVKPQVGLTIEPFDLQAMTTCQSRHPMKTIEVYSTQMVPGKVRYAWPRYQQMQEQTVAGADNIIFARTSTEACNIRLRISISWRRTDDVSTDLKIENPAGFYECRRRGLSSPDIEDRFEEMELPAGPS